MAVKQKVKGVPPQTATDAPNDLQTYKEAVNELARLRSSLIFQNDNINHASIVIEAIIENSEKEVLIYDDKLNGDISDKSSSFLETVNEFVVAHHGSVKIVVEDTNGGNESNIETVLRNLVKVHPGKVDVRKQSAEFRNEIGRVCQRLQIQTKVHYTVGDSRMFRLEFPAGPRKALCSFNSSAVAGQLRKPFDVAFGTCEKYFQTETA